MLLACWNVNGLRAAGRKGFVEWLQSFAPDLCLLQETKTRIEELPAELTAVPGYRLRLHPAVRKGYSGVGCYAREEPDEWLEGLGDARFDDEGRILWARYGDLLIGSVYFPNSQAAGRRLELRLAFGARLLEFLAEQRRAGRRVILGGDFNVAHHEIDLARPAANVGNPGFLPAEREWMTDFLAAGHADVWRERNPTVADGYTWWTYRFQARQKNIGWRLDYFCVDRELLPTIRDARILSEVTGSDHCPITLEYHT